MKVGIVTLCGHYNYGNRLQNFALHRVLNMIGNNVETLWIEDKVYMVDPYLKIDFKNVVKFVINWNNFRQQHKLHLDSVVYDSLRQKNIKSFSDKYIPINYSFDFDNSRDLYDYFIVGSDQVWNIQNIEVRQKYLKLLSLSFASSYKRIAYAASFGLNNIVRFKEKFKEFLNGIPHISVREEAGARIIKELTGRDVPVLVDPTLLLSREEWQRIEIQPEWYKGEKYILTYFLGDVPKILKQLADKYGYKIYNLMDKEDLNLYTSRVEEFLWLIEHAQLVCTDSFHACVFSIIFNTPFLVVNRKQAGVADMTSRLDTLMKLFGYQDRFIDFNCTDIDFDKVMTMDFSNVLYVQNRERERSLKFLREAMNLE